MAADNVWPAMKMVDEGYSIRMILTEAPEEIDRALMAAKRGGLRCEPPNRAVFPFVSLVNIQYVRRLSRAGQKEEAAA